MQAALPAGSNVRVVGAEARIALTARFGPSLPVVEARGTLTGPGPIVAAKALEGAEARALHAAWTDGLPDFRVAATYTLSGADEPVTESRAIRSLRLVPRQGGVAVEDRSVGHTFSRTGMTTRDFTYDAAVRPVRASLDDALILGGFART